MTFLSSYSLLAVNFSSIKFRLNSRKLSMMYRWDACTEIHNDKKNDD